jgi:hypothetical protein
MRLRCIEHVPCVDGSHIDWEFADPNRLLAEAVDHSPGLAAMISDAVRRSPPSMARPWSLIVGFDEFVPGNKLQADNRRKSMVLSFTFRELGPAAMSSALAWHTPVIVRTQIIGQVAGGWSHLLALYLKKQLLGPSGLATAGVPLTLNGEVVLIFAKLTNLLSDGDGLRQAFNWKGASGLKPCFKHFNVFNKNTDLAARDPGYVEIGCHDVNAFRSWTPAQLNKMVDLLRAAAARVVARTMTKGEFNDLQITLGLNYNPLGLLADCSSSESGDSQILISHIDIHIYVYRYIYIYLSLSISLSLYMYRHFCFLLSLSI